MNAHGTRPLRFGFTMIELLVVMALITILVCLLLPAVMQCREAARRSMCRNNLRNISVAIHNYEEAHETLPPGVSNPAGPIASTPSGYHLSWIAQILPQMDDGNVYKQIQWTRGAYDPANQTVRSTPLKMFRCGSDGAPTVASSPAGIVAMTNYRGCHHDTEAPIDVDNNGVLFLNSAIRYEQIEDGSSNTILMGEAVCGTDSMLGWISGTRSTLRNTGASINAGKTWPGNTVGPMTENSAPAFVGSFSSYHTGGAHFAMCDGSVRFISENITPQLLQRLAHRTDGELVSDF